MFYLKDRIDTKKLANLSLLLTIAIVMGYLESLIPFDLGIPGIKIGLANWVIVIVLYLYGIKESLLISVLRVFIVGLLFFNFSMLLYSLVGTIFAIIFMFLLKKTKIFSVVGVSIIGGIMHNIGQWLVAYGVLQSSVLYSYLPHLIIAGLVAGMVIGLIVKFSLPRLTHLTRFINN